MNPSSTRAYPARLIFCILLLALAFSFNSYSQVKPPTIVVNPGSMVINGTPFIAKSMLAPTMFKVLGKPDKTDTLKAAQLESLNDFAMATLNRYSNGLLLMQGKNTERVNRVNLYINPLASKKYIDYINTPFKGKLTLLGMKIDSNTTIRQVEKALARFNPDLSEEYQSLDFVVFDAKGTRLVEVWINYLKDSEKIEYIRLKFFPTPPLKKHAIEYKEGKLFLNSILLDTAAGKISQIKKLLGEPNAIIDISYRGLNGHVYKTKRHYYDDISGITLVENPSNQGLLAIQLDFLSLRGKESLGNPVFDLVVNKKKFDPENAVPNGPSYAKAHYSLDSISTSVDEKENKTIVSSMNRYGSLEFIFAGKYNWEKRVYYVNYHLATVRPPSATVSEPVSAPSLEVKQGMLILKTSKNSAYWTGSVNSPASFKDLMGKLSTTSTADVSEFPSFGTRMWTKQGSLDAIEFYLAKYMNPYSGNNDAPGYYTGTIVVEGVSLSKESTLDKVQSALSMYNLQKAYDNKNHTVLKGNYRGFDIYLTFGITDKKLIAVSFNR